MILRFSFYQFFLQFDDNVYWHSFLCISLLKVGWGSTCFSEFMIFIKFLKKFGHFFSNSFLSLLSPILFSNSNYTYAFFDTFNYVLWGIITYISFSSARIELLRNQGLVLFFYILITSHNICMGKAQNIFVELMRKWMIVMTIYWWLTMCYILF